MSAGGLLLPKQIQSILNTESLGRRMYCLARVDSTNRLAAELARQGEGDGTVVVADFQTAGRGRGDHRWLSPPGSSLLFSLILRPDRTAADVLPVTLGFSLAIAERMSGMLGTDVGVKWPNDVVTPAGKLCGILAESSTRGGKVALLVVGVGVNVNVPVPELPVAEATSCLALTGRTSDRRVVLAELLDALETMRRALDTSGFGAVAGRYESRLSLMGRHISVRGRDESGEVTGVRPDGALVFRTAAGAERTLYDGEVTAH